MHVLELSDGDTVILSKAVETRLREMREELVHTDDRAYREGLKADLIRLESIGKTIGATVESEKALY